VNLRSGKGSSVHLTRSADARSLIQIKIVKTRKDEFENAKN